MTYIPDILRKNREAIHSQRLRLPKRIHSPRPLVPHRPEVVQ